MPRYAEGAGDMGWSSNVPECAQRRKRCCCRAGGVMGKGRAGGRAGGKQEGEEFDQEEEEEEGGGEALFAIKNGRRQLTRLATMLPAGKMKSQTERATTSTGCARKNRRQDELDGHALEGAEGEEECQDTTALWSMKTLWRFSPWIWNEVRKLLL